MNWTSVKIELPKSHLVMLLVLRPNKFSGEGNWWHRALFCRDHQGEKFYEDGRILEDVSHWMEIEENPA